MKTLTAKTITHSLILAIVLASCGAPKSGNSSANGGRAISPLSTQNVDATLWFATSAENYYLFKQTYHYATEALKLRMQSFKGPLSPCIIIDLDETVLDNSPYQLELIRKGETFTEKSWEDWVMRAEAKLTPGAAEFLAFCETNGIQVFYISNRDAKQLEATLNNMMKYNLPFVSPNYVLLKQDDSNKTERRNAVILNATPLLYLGDNLLDYTERFVLRTDKHGKPTVDMFLQEMLQNFVLFPNPMYGQWMKAFDDPTQPAANDAAKAARKVMVAKPTDDF